LGEQGKDSDIRFTKKTNMIPMCGLGFFERKFKGKGKPQHKKNNKWKEKEKTGKIALREKMAQKKAEERGGDKAAGKQLGEIHHRLGRRKTKSAYSRMDGKKAGSSRSGSEGG